MRRLAGYVALFIGVFLLVFGVLARVYMYPRLALAPIDQDTVTVSEAPGATIFDRSQLKTRPAHLVARRTVIGDVRASERAGDNTAVWNVSVDIYEPGGNPIRTVSDRVAFDRVTSEARNCCDENIDGVRKVGDVPVRHEGIEYKFPFDTEKKTYRYFDTTLGRATDMRFVSQTKIQGLSVYQFEQVIPPTPVGPHIIGGTLNLPQSVLGRTGPDLPVVQHYANKRTVYVEPKTGVIVRGEEQQFSTYRDAAGTDVLTLTQANLAFNPATVKQQVETAKESRSSLRMIGTILPIAGALLGLLLTLLGVFLILSTAPAPRRARARRDEPVSV
ncbi:MAG TPA: DUF3068 domain-containing protein [Mycobacteriales bacterium]|jgi:hypothetical protein|nr:DUF3068 domain-containing protein [Mycobacteriales bacterium]